MFLQLICWVIIDIEPSQNQSNYEKDVIKIKKWRNINKKVKNEENIF